MEDLLSFFDFARKSKVVNPNVVHNWSGAIGAISRCLTEEERTVDFLQEHLDTLKTRMANRKPEVSPSTLDSYVQRASNALVNFASWKADPAEWEKEFASQPHKRGPRKPTAKPVEAAPVAPQAVAEPAPKKAYVSSGEAPSTRNSVRVPTEQGDSIRLEFPDSFAMSDVLKVAWTLAVHARDFDPEKLLKGFGKPGSSR